MDCFRRVNVYLMFCYIFKLFYLILLLNFYVLFRSSFYVENIIISA